MVQLVGKALGRTPHFQRIQTQAWGIVWSWARDPISQNNNLSQLKLKNKLSTCEEGRWITTSKAFQLCYCFVRAC